MPFDPLLPFATPGAWLWHTASGAKAHDRAYDSAGRPVRYPLGPHLRDLRYDPADRITRYTHYLASTGAAAPALDQQFGYDELNRLTQWANTTSTATTVTTISYDANGNRTLMNINGVNGSYTSATDSNRMLQAPFPDRSFSHDPAGNILTSNAGLATFDAAGRLAELQSSAGTTHYGYNALGQRVIKESNAVDRSVIFGPVGIPPLPRRTTSVIYVYDLGQRLLGEYDGATGQAQREYIWLQDIPVAMITPDPTASTGQPLVYFIHTDHLNTPRVVG